MEQQAAPFWRKETLNWYLRAAEYGDYHRKLADMLVPWLEGTVCDLGCGPGCLSLALLKYLPQVTALDVDRDALASLREHAKPGLTILEGNAMELPEDMLWDTLVLSFFGRITEKNHFDYFMSHCRKRLISIVGGGPKSSFSATGASAKKKEYIPQVEAFLRQRGCRYHLEEHILEFGQPLRDMEDARAFVKGYSPKSCPSLSDAELRERLCPLENGGFYLPYEKHFGIFVVEKE